MKYFRWIRNTLLIAALLAAPSGLFAQFAVSINIAPPELPVYEQPPCPDPNYLWTPGYWSWGGEDVGYYWVPGTWVEAPEPGLLWTPGYWGWNDGNYAWNAGYWGPQVGFYGGVDYGFGYGGEGFYGGRWDGDRFSYNTAVVNVNTTIIHNTYVDRTVIRNTGNHVSFNGGQGGIQARPNERQMAAARTKRFGPVSAQTRQVSLARNDRQNFASVNHGKPAHAALQRPATSAADFNRAAPARSGHPYNAKPAAAAGRNGTEARPAARNEARPANGTAGRPAARNEARPTNGTAARPAARNEARPAATRNEARPATRTEARPAAGTHTAARPETRTESTRPATRPEARTESRPASRTEARPAPAARPETHTAPRTEARPAPARTEARPAPASHASRPAPAARPESRPAPAARPAARPAPARTESRPAAHPATRPEQKPNDKKPQGL